MKRAKKRILRRIVWIGMILMAAGFLTGCMETSEDECIVKEICKRVKSIRLSCCFSQQEFADKAGVSIVTIKRIESCKVSDIALSTLLKILRISGTLEGVVGLVPELPDSPFLINEKTGKRIQRINGKRKMV